MSNGRGGLTLAILRRHSNDAILRALEEAAYESGRCKHSGAGCHERIAQYRTILLERFATVSRDKERLDVKRIRHEVFAALVERWQNAPDLQHGVPWRRMATEAADAVQRAIDAARRAPRPEETGEK